MIYIENFCGQSNEYCPLISDTIIEHPPGDFEEPDQESPATRRTIEVWKSNSFQAR